MEELSNDLTKFNQMYLSQYSTKDMPVFLVGHSFGGLASAIMAS